MAQPWARLSPVISSVILGQAEGKSHVSVWNVVRGNSEQTNLPVHGAQGALGRPPLLLTVLVQPESPELRGNTAVLLKHELVIYLTDMLLSFHAVCLLICFVCAFTGG